MMQDISEQKEGSTVSSIENPTSFSSSSLK
jgi:hypothetical protein